MTNREMLSLFGGDGPFMAVPGYSPRRQQIELASEIKKVIDDGGVLLAEAGTGTGKSFAALAPSILSSKRTVVATASIALQEQYLKNDIPKLKTILNKPQLRVALLKGRGNFICRLNADDLDRRHFLTDTQIKTIRFLRESGDRSDLKINIPDDEWEGISAGHDDDCSGKACPDYEDCYYYKQRAKALDADLVIANYHILFLDQLVMGGDMLGEFHTLIADEAHKVPEIARNFLELKISGAAFKRILSKLGKINEYTDVFADVEAVYDRFVYQLSKLQDVPADEPLEAEVFSGFNLVREKCKAIDRRLLSYIDDLEEEEHWSKSLRTLKDVSSRMSQIVDRLAVLTDTEDESYIRWIMSNQSRTIKMQMLDVSGVLSAIFDRIHSSTLMSATLRASDGFGLIQRETGLVRAKTLALANVFNFKKQVHFHSPEPTDMPDPSGDRDGYISAVAQRVGDIVELTRGRTMALFTSVEALKRAQQELAERFPQLHIYTQGDLASQRLVEKFKADPQAVLLGTRTFFEGIDVPGDALSCVILDRFPFHQLGDPLIKARQNKDPRGFYWNWYLPSALIVFKQAFGRLIRTSSDHGVFIILDPRVKYKYHQSICKTIQEDIPITEWDGVAKALSELTEA